MDNMVNIAVNEATIDILNKMNGTGPRKTLHAVLADRGIIAWPGEDSFKYQKHLWRMEKEGIITMTKTSRETRITLVDKFKN